MMTALDICTVEQSLDAENPTGNLIIAADLAAANNTRARVRA